MGCQFDRTLCCQFQMIQPFPLNDPETFTNFHGALYHFVCLDSTKDRNDLSHAIHGDNCHTDSFGRCRKKPPAFTWRDWSAITYLNGDFEGGEFIFAHTNQTVQVSTQSGLQH